MAASRQQYLGLIAQLGLRDGDLIPFHGLHVTNQILVGRPKMSIGRVNQPQPPAALAGAALLSVWANNAQLGPAELGNIRPPDCDGDINTNLTAYVGAQMQGHVRVGTEWRVTEAGVLEVHILVN